MRIRRNLSVFLLCCICLCLFSACAAEPAEVSYDFRHIHMSLTLPDGWTYEIVPVPETAESWEDLQGSKYGIAFRPEDAPACEMGLYFHTDEMGLCGFGVQHDTLTLDNGATAQTYRYDDLEEGASWYIYYDGEPDNYVLHGIVPAEYEEAFLEIARSVTVGGGTLSPEKAVALAEPYTTKPYMYTTETYNGWDGSWTIRFAPKASLTDPEVFLVTAEGTVSAAVLP